MSVAVITIFCNESFRIPKWLEYYEAYKSEAALHIVVDNNSTPDESAKVRQAFPDSHYIKLEKNGGVTAAYNAGIRFAMEHTEIDAVAFIGNDIKLEPGGLTKLYEFLMSDEKFGEVGPVLLKKDSMIIEDNGDWFGRDLIMNEFDLGKEYSEDIQSHVCDGLPGAMNMGKISMYQQIGLMDETLFMYSDEVDVGIRAKRAGYIFSSCAPVKAWHQHENTGNRKNRLPFSNYLVMRNKVYLAGHHFGNREKWYVFFAMMKISCLSYLGGVLKRDKEKRTRAVWQIRGAINGLTGNMEHNRYSNPGGV